MRPRLHTLLLAAGRVPADTATEVGEFKSPSCGRCETWVEHLRRKPKAVLPPSLRACP